jgi:phosphoribosylformimino-5-aminoimidazole carboxamide ribotide isomerase
MKIIPAIDLRDGRCVRLRQGDFGAETVYSDDPARVSESWQQQGATWLHVVDLDGARSGASVHTATIRDICRAATVPVQVGGGMRTLEAVESTLAAGARRVVLGTAALEDPAMLAQALRLWPDQIAVSLDARDGLLTTHGWLTETSRRATTVAEALASAGVRCIIYTDIARDGTLGGPNFAAIRAIQQVAGEDVEVLASGGVGSLADLLQLRELGVAGVIIGKALYTGDVSLAGALALVEEDAYGR